MHRAVKKSRLTKSSKIDDQIVQRTVNNKMKWQTATVANQTVVIAIPGWVSQSQDPVLRHL